MTAPEPLALEKFIKDVAAKYPHGGLVWLGDPSRYPRKVWVILDKFGDDGVRQTDYARRWEDLVEQFYSHPVPVVARDEAAELRAAMAEMSDLVYIIRHAEEELGNAPLLRDMGVSTAHMREAIESAWERLCALAALHDDTSALAATEGQP